MTMQKDIAQQLGISVSTVSRALANHPKVSQEIKEKVNKIANKLGYVSRKERIKNGPNIKAAVVHVFAWWSVGKKLSEIAMILLKELSKMAQTLNVTLSLHFIASLEELQETQNGDPRNYLLQDDTPQCALFILGCPREVVMPISKIIPSASINHHYPNLKISTFVSSEIQDIEILMQKLCDVGHRRIAYMTSLFSSPIGVRRYAGYLSFLSRQKMPIDIELVYNIYKKDLGEIDFKENIVDELRDKGVTAILFSTGYQASEFSIFLKNNGIEVPGEFSIVAYDHLTYKSKIDITGIEPRYDGIVSEAMLFLTEFVNKKRHKHINLEVNGRFVQGDSVKSINL